MLSKLSSYMFDLKQKWEDNGLVFLAVISIIFLCLYALTRIGKVGTYSEYAYDSLWSPRFYTLPPPKKYKPKDSTGERLCREYLERRFKLPFKKARPDFLKNPVMGGYNLELDCFNPDLKLAIEYNGVQHYKFVPYFHKNKEAFANQKYRDEMKRTKCRENGICLIEVPYTIPHHKIESFISEQLSQNRLN